MFRVSQMLPQIQRNAIPSLARIRQLAIGIFLSAGLLIGLTLVAVFEAPASGTAENTHPALTVAETLYGPGRARLAETDMGTLLLVDGSPEDAETITQQITAVIAGSETGAADVSIKVYPFAPGYTGGIATQDLAILLILGMITAASGWMTFQLSGASSSAVETSPRAEPEKVASPRYANDPSYQKLKHMASQDPGQIAKAIHAWMAKETRS